MGEERTIKKIADYCELLKPKEKEGVPMTKKEIPLTLFTKEQKMRIWQVIHANTQEGDRRPSEVVADAPYNGNEEKYLREMAHWHKVAL